MNRSSPILPASAWLAIAAVAAVAYFVAAFSGIDWVWLMWITKPIPVLCLAAALPNWSPRQDRYRVMLLAGLVLSAIGDLFMMKNEWFIFGLSSFLFAHICYIVAFCSRSESPVKLYPLRILPFLVYGAIMLRFLWPTLGELRVPVLMYVAVILTMGWRAAARVGQPGELRPAHWLGLLGAISFILSDSFIAIGKFVGPIPAERFLIMGTYWAGQLGIALSVARNPKNSV